MSTIFISIASYRDSELINTIKDILINAEHPNNLRFGICFQDDDINKLEEYVNDKRFKIINIHYSITKGCCWARSMVQKLYDNETYTLQLDSHHRFVKNWDTILIDMFLNLKKDGVDKPLITTYLPSYNPNNDPQDRIMCPWSIKLDKVIENNILLFIPDYIMNHKELTKPIKGDFFSGHFSFTHGNFCNEIPYDDNLYFIGEEINISLRSYTHGYEIYYPHILVAWHEYTRKHRTKHWDDDKEWWKKDKKSKQYFSLFLNNDISLEEKFKLGKVKDISTYPHYNLLYNNINI
jgi:hypothetical protein